MSGTDNNDVLHIVWLQPGYRYSYVGLPFVSGQGWTVQRRTLGRQLRELNTCTAAWYRRWLAKQLLEDVYDNVMVSMHSIHYMATYD
jgi:hypothetical protein